MKGDFYIDFAIATILFILVFSFLFYYYNSEFNLKIQQEKEKSAYLEIQNIFNSLPKKVVEKRIIILSGNSTNEFVNLSGYDIDLILDEANNRICFDPNLNGFITNVSTLKKFYLYSTEQDIDKHTCNILNFNNSLTEKISTPIYEQFIAETGTYRGNYCEQKTILTFSDLGPKQRNLKICS